MSRRMLLVLALTCGVAVGNVYFPQAVSPLIAEGLGLSPDAAAVVVTATQFGYAAGIFLLVPLGDRVPYRPLLVTLLGLTGAGLLAAGAAPSLPPLVVASALVGTTTVIAPLAGTLAAGLVSEERRGVAGGTLLSGSIGGMLLSRTLGGTLAEWLGWRAPYLVTGVAVLALAVLLARALPRTRAPSAEPYPTLLAGTWQLLRTEPLLRRSVGYQATVFAAFSAVWTSVALLLTGPAYGLDARAVGALALVNAVTMCCTPVAGRLVDRHGPDPVNRVCALAVLASAAVLAPAAVPAPGGTDGGTGGGAGLVALVLGTLLLDVGMQSGMVANQVRIYALRAEVRGRLSTAYMTCAYLGGAAGSWLGLRAYAAFGWGGVCGLVAVLATAALTRGSRERRRTRGPRKAGAPTAPAGADGGVGGGVGRGCPGLRAPGRRAAP